MTDRFQEEGAKRGAIGYIIETYEDTFEVEFSDHTGTTIAQIVAKPAELESCESETSKESY